MHRTIRRTVAVAAATGLSVMAVGAPAASAESIVHQLGCADGQPSGLFALLPVECGIYNPGTHSYEPYDPAKDTSGPLGFGILGL